MHVAAQTKVVKHKAKQAAIVGFKTGRDLMFNTGPLLNRLKTKINPSNTASLFLKKSINSHFKAEAAIKYSTFPNTSTLQADLLNKFPRSQKKNTFAIPASVNYYLLPEKSVVHPYFGAGLQINGNGVNPYSPSYPGSSYTDNAPESGTKYISILFTQGVTFEINTKIQITESMHFIPANNNKVLGIDLGIGYSLP